MPALLAPAAWYAPGAEAREVAPAAIDISARSLPDAIAELSREAHVSIGTDGPLPRIRTRKLRGDMSVNEALGRLLSGSGYVARQVSPTAWRIEPTAPARPVPVAPETSRPPEAPPITIMVTATKQPVDLFSASAAIAVVSPDGIGRGGANGDSATIASRLEGLSLTSLGPGRNRMFLRGVADSAFSGESQSTVAVVLDDARLTYAAPDPDIRLVDMARVEVLKGPQGSLYGTGALGGIYHMVSNGAQLGQTSLAASTSGSAVRHGGTGASLSAIANLPLLMDNAAIRIVGYAAHEPGWIDTGTRKDSNATKVSGARVMLGIEPTPDWRLDLTGFGQWLSSHDSRYTYEADSTVRPAQGAEPHDNDLRHMAARLSGKLDDIDLLLASAMTWHDVGNRFDATVGADAFNLADPQFLIDDRKYRTWDTELRLRGSLGSLQWLAGLSHIDASQRLALTLENADAASISLDDDSRDSHDSAAYFDATVPISGTLTLDAGVRLFHSVVRETRHLPQGMVHFERRKSGFTPSLALAWQPSVHRLFYLRYGSAFRQGGADIAASGDIEALKGDELASIEAGWRERLAGSGLIEVNAWASRWENVQSDALGDDGLIETVNAGNAQILGLEASLDLPLSPGWHLEAGASWTDARLVRNASGLEIEDTRLPVVPEYALRGALRHDFSLGSVDLWARAGLRYVGPSHMSFDAEVDRAMGKVLESELELNADTGRWTLGLRLENLFANGRNVFAYGNPLRYASMPQFTPQQPATATVTVSAAF